MKRNKLKSKYINGTKGIISIFLALVISPLLSIALLLVESARYQDAAELMGEIMNSAAFSTLADYDSYLDERFGVLSVAQNNDINSTFKGYLDENVKSLGKSIGIMSETASGKYALSDTKLLKQQLLEYGEISVAAETVFEGFNIDELLDNLTEALDVAKLNKEIKAMKSVADVAKEVASIVKGIKKLKKTYKKKYKPAFDEYETQYEAFKGEANNLIDVLKGVQEKLVDGEDPSAIYNNTDVKDAIEEFNKKRDKYSDAASDLSDKLGDLKDKVDDVVSKANSLPSKIEECNENLADSEDTNSATTSAYEWFKIVVGQITHSFEKIGLSGFDDRVNTECRALDEQVNKLDAIEDTTIGSDWTEDKIIEEYGKVNLGIESNFESELDQLITNLDNDTKTSDDNKSVIGNLLDIFGELLGLSGLYDSNLDSVVEDSYFYNNVSMSTSSTMTVKSITDLSGACRDFKDAISDRSGNPIKVIVKTFTSLYKLLKSIVEFLGAIVTWITGTLGNILTIIGSGPSEWYNYLLLYGYGAYNLPNRTNYSSGKTLSGYSYSKVYEMAGGLNRNANLTKALNDFDNIAFTDGADKMFKGAEAEYVLAGSNSELQNQSVTFFDLYLLRLVLDVIPILTDHDVNTISMTAGPFAWAVKIAIVIIEPLLETFILVNGGKEYLFNNDIYISFSGFVKLQTDLAKVTTGISDGLKSKIEDAIKNHNGTPPRRRSFCNASYTEHLFILFLSVKQSTYLKRLQNIMQIESAENYDYEFKLNKSYTYLYMDVNYKLNTMFNVDGIANRLSAARCKQYLGY